MLRRAGLRATVAALVLCFAELARAQDPEPDDELRRPARLTVGVADDLLGQLSPDGKTLYFVSNRNTTNQLFAQNVSDGRSHMLFDEDADVTWPRVSPDGRWLLYISFGEHAAGQLCLRRLPEGDARRCLADPAAALQAEWIDRGRIALVSRASAASDLRVLEVSVDGDLTARPLLDRNLTSPAISPDGRWMIYVPVERTVAGVGPGFAAKAASRLEATRLGADGRPTPATPPVPLTVDLPGQTGQPVFARDGRSIFVVQFFSDSNHDGVIDADDNGILFRVPISFTNDAPVLGAPEQLTDTSWNCEYPAPSADRLVATCSQRQGLDVYALPLDGEVPAEWSVDQLRTAEETAPNRVEQQLLAGRRLLRETTVSGRRLAMLRLVMLHLDLEEYRAAEFYAEHVQALHDPATGGVSRPLLALVEQRRAARNRERGRTLEGFGAGARHRLEELHPKPTASAMAVALTHLVRSEIADSIGDKAQARSELEATVLNEATPAPIVEAYYQRADAFYRGVDDRDALAAACRRLSEDAGLSLDERLRYARAAVRAMIRGLPADEADARLARERAGVAEDSELAFAVDLVRIVSAMRGDQPQPEVHEALRALYERQSRPGRRAALVAEAVRRATAVGARGELEALARRRIAEVRPGSRERRDAERLFRRVMTDRAYRDAAEHRYAEARADFDAIVEQTRSYEAVVGAVDMRLKAGEAHAQIAASYEKAGTPPALARFAKAYVLARQMPKLEGDEHARAAAEAMAALKASWSELKDQRIAQSLYGALLHEEYLRTGELASAEKANVHYLIALELMGNNVRFRAMILGQLGLLHTEVGNYRIALGYLLDRDKLPYTDSAEGLAVHLALARALLHMGREDEAAATADRALAMVDRYQPLGRYRSLALDRAALCNLAAGRFARALGLYDQEIPLLESTPSAATPRNRFVLRVARAAAAVGAGQPARALEDLAEVDARLGDGALVAGLRWPHASTEHVVRTYRLVASGLRARANAALGRLDEEQKATAERQTILAASFARTKRPEVERQEMLAEAQLALNAGLRRDKAATSSWLTSALARSDDLRAGAHGAFDRDELDLTVLAAELTVDLGSTLVADLPQRMRAAATDVIARHEPELRSYRERFEAYGPLIEPESPEAGARAQAGQ